MGGAPRRSDSKGGVLRWGVSCKAGVDLRQGSPRLGGRRRGASEGGLSEAGGGVLRGGGWALRRGLSKAGGGGKFPWRGDSKAGGSGGASEAEGSPKLGGSEVGAS